MIQHALQHHRHAAPEGDSFLFQGLEERPGIEFFQKAHVATGHQTVRGGGHHAGDVIDGISVDLPHLSGPPQGLLRQGLADDALVMQQGPLRLACGA